MALDIGKPTIEVAVTATGIEKTTRDFDTFGQKGEANANRVRDAYKQVAASAMDFARAGANANQIAQLTGASMKEAREAAALYAKTLAVTEDEVRSLRAANQELAEAGLLKVTNATKAVTEAATKANPVLNTMRSSLTSMAASALQTAPGVGQVVSVLGNLAIGAGPMVAVLAGIAAVTFAWQKLTESARAATKEHEKLRDVLKQLADRDKFSVEKALAAETTRFRSLSDELAKVQARWADLRSQGSGGGLAAVGFEREIGRLKREIEESKRLVLAGVDDVTRGQIEAYSERTAAAKAASDAAATAGARALEAYKREATALAQTAFEAERVANALAKIAARGMPGVQFAERGISRPDVAPLPGFAPPAVVDEYMRDIGRIWRDGIGKIVTDGFKSFHDFFEDVFQLFTKLLDKMQAAGKGDSFGAKLLGLGAAGIGGGLAGYQSGSGGLGFLSGAAAGGAIGGPFGAVIGGLAGAAGGLLGAAKEQREAAEASKQAADQFRQTMAGFRASLGTPVQQQLFNLSQQTTDAQGYVSGQTAAGHFGEVFHLGSSVSGRAGASQTELDDYIRKATEKIKQDFIDSITEAYNATRGPAGEYANALNAIKKQYDDAIASAKTLGLGQEVLDKIEATRVAREQQLADAMKATADAAQKAAEAVVEAARKMNEASQQNSLLRFFDATGQGDLAYALRQALEITQALADGLDGVSVELIKQAQAAEKAARENERSAQAAEQIRDAQRDALQIQSRAIEEQIRGAQEILNTTRQAIDSVRKYIDSSKLGTLSPLSPQNRYDEARRQYLALGQAASGGDIKAFAALPDAVEAFRRESENINAHNARYRDDFNASQIFLESLTDKFGVQATIQEQMLAVMQSQLAVVQQQLDAQRQTLEATKANKPPTAEQIAIAIGAPSGPRVDPTLPPGTGGPIGPPRRIPIRNLDDLYERLNSIHGVVSSTDAKAYSQLEVTGRTHNVISDQLPTQTDYQRQTRDYTKATVDGIGKLRPIDVGGPIR